MLNPEDNIEDIYRDFAKNYPLKTDDSGWDEFLQKMEGAPVKGLPANEPGVGSSFAGMVKKYSYWLAAAALVVIMLGALLFKNKIDNNGPPATLPKPAYDATTAPAVKQLAPPLQAGKGLQAGNKIKQKQSTTTTTQPAIAAPTPKQIPANGTTEGVVATSKHSTPAIEQKMRLKTFGIKQQNPSAHSAEPLARGLAKNGITKANDIKPLGKQDTGAPTRLSNSTPAHGKTDVKNSQIVSLPGTASNNANGRKAFNKSTTADGQNQGLLPLAINPNNAKQADSNNTMLVNGGYKVQTGQEPTVTNVADNTVPPTLLSDSLQNGVALNNPLSTQDGTPNTAASPKKQANKATAVQPMVKIKAGGRKYFYLGFATGPDLSTVKFQQVKNTGFAVGVLLGAHLNNNISIETGLLYTAKKYYSSAVYFKSNGLPPPDRDDLQSLNADGKFVEVPITVKYTFINKKHYNVFLNGGVSSYFTSDEKYDLLLHRPFGNEVRHDDDDRSCANMFSIIHLSAGYEFKLNASNAIRLEPYLKIPLSGLGAGALPVTSGGFYINFTHSFFK